MAKKIILIPVKSTWNWHSACELEIIERELEKKSEITIIIPNWLDVSCDTVGANVTRPNAKAKSRWYINKYRKLFKLLSKKVKVIEAPRAVLPKEFEDWLKILRSKVSSLSELSEQEFQGLDIGSGAVSSYISQTRKINVDIAEVWDSIESLLRSSYAMFVLTKEWIQKEHADTVLTFNGRFASPRGIIRAAEKSGVDYWLHERGCSKDHFEIYINHLPHDQKYFSERMAIWLKNETAETIETAGNSFYESRRLGKERGWFSFVSDQVLSKLPESWDENKRNIVIFNSSEDEFVSIGKEWKNPIYPNQIDGVKEILRDASGVDTVFWLRMHPNLRSVAEKELEEWATLEKEFDNIRVISPFSDVSTYALVDAASIVLTFGSSVGIEATYWGNVSILAGTCFYRELNAAHTASSHADVVRFIRDRDLVAKDKQSAIEYGAFFNSFGKKFKFAEALDLRTVRFNNSYVKASLLYSIPAWGIKPILKSYLKTFNVIRKLRSLSKP